MFPRFALEAAAPSNRAKLYLGVRLGYVVCVLFAGLALAGDAVGVITAAAPFYLLIATKAATNTLMWWCLNTDRGVVESSSLNLLADITLMTAGIYISGGPVSPMFSLYVLEIAVIGLLANPGSTIASAVIVLLQYGAMSLLIQVGVLAPVPPPAGGDGLISAEYAAFDMVRAVILVGVGTLFITFLLDKLRDKERALAERTDQLVEANQQKGQFMMNVTHELRTPIHAISALTEIVEQGIYGDVTERQAEAQREIRQNAEHLLRLVDDLIDLSKAEAGRLTFDLTAVDVQRLIDGAVASMAGLVQTQGLRCRTEVPDALPQARADRRKLSQILLNLLGNAVKFTPGGGTITLAARSEDEAIVIEVVDTGIGIPADQLDRIFEEFQQVDRELTRAHGGFGLGLPLARRFAEGMGGSLSAASRLGEGSTFTLTLPVAAPPAPADDEPVAAS